MIWRVFWRSIWVSAVLVLGFFPVFLQGQNPLQLDQPHRLQYGASIGSGGVHVFLKPSFDLQYRGTTGRLAPGLFFLSMQVSQDLLKLQPRNQRQPMPLFISLGYHNDWLLGKRLWTHNNDDLPKRKNLEMHTLMFGTRYRLDNLGHVYWELSAGALLARERFQIFQQRVIDDRFQVFPMIELRLGGFFQFHKHDRQKWPDSRF